jgi:hypothetical protein
VFDSYIDTDLQITADTVGFSSPPTDIGSTYMASPYGPKAELKRRSKVR